VNKYTKYLEWLKPIYSDIYSRCGHTQQEIQVSWGFDSTRYKSVGRYLIKHIVNEIRHKRCMVILRERETDLGGFKSNVTTFDDLDYSNFSFENIYVKEEGLFG